MKQNCNLNNHSDELNNILNQPMGFMERWSTLIIFLLSLLLLFCGLNMYAQTTATTLRGFVRTEANMPVSGINVIVTQKNQKYKILGACKTDKDGGFSVSFHSTADSISVNCSGMTIKTSHENYANKDAFVTIFAEEKAQKLKEVTVKAQKIYVGGDTVNYNVASFLNKNDQNIGEVLKRMPGITVSNTGQISYKGLPIKNFYIEGLDLMKGRYGIATNNIDPNNIATVMVLENHQDIKALKNLCPEERASINLKLKNGVKGVFNLIGTLGGGYDDKTLWTDEWIATYFRRNAQLLATYKGNNVGTDLEAELRSFDNDDYSRTSSLTGIDMPSTPGIAKRYYYFNQSQCATANNVYRLGKNGNIGFNVGFLFDHDNRNSQSVTNSLLPDGALNTVHESVSAIMKKTAAYGNVSCMENTERKYLQEQLSFDYSYMTGSNHIENDGVISQSGEVSEYRLHNALHLTYKFNKERGVDWISKLNMEKRPHSLFVDRNLFLDILSSETMSQWVERKNIELNNRIGMLSSLVVGNLQVSPTLFCDILHDKLESILEQYKNLLSLSNAHTGLDINAIYRKGNVCVDISIPIGWRGEKMEEHFSDFACRYSRLCFEPSAKIEYCINASHSLAYRMGLSSEMPTIENLYAGYILNNYRQLSFYDSPMLYEGRSFFNKLSYNYKNIFKLFFLDVDLLWNRLSPKMLYGSTYEGVVEKLESKQTDKVQDKKNVMVNASKGFDWKRMKVAMICSYSHTDSPVLLQGEVLDYKSSALNVKLDVSATFFEWLTLSHASSFYHIDSWMTENVSMATLCTMSNDTSVDFNLPGGVSLSTTLTHYYNSLNESNKSFVLGELSVKYAYKRWMFTLLCNNIFNKKLYTRSVSSGLTENISGYSIRQRGLLFTVRYRVF